MSVGNEVAKFGGGSPDPHAAPSDYVSAVGDLAATVAGMGLILIGVCLFVPFFHTLAALLAPDDSSSWLAGATRAGGTLTAALALTGAAPQITAAIMLDDGELTPALAKALGLLNAGSWILTWVGIALAMTVASCLGLRHRRLPRPVAWSGLALGVALLGAALLVWVSDGVMLVWMLSMLWLIATSVVVALRAPALLEPEPAGALPSPARRT